jgi:hypothetical protein
MNEGMGCGTRRLSVAARSTPRLSLFFECWAGWQVPPRVLTLVVTCVTVDDVKRHNEAIYNALAHKRSRKISCTGEALQCVPSRTGDRRGRSALGEGLPLSDGQFESATAPTARTAQIARVPAWSVDRYGCCSRSGDHCCRNRDLQLRAACDQGG